MPPDFHKIPDSCINVFLVLLLFIGIAIIIGPVVIGYKYLQASYLLLFGPAIPLFAYLSYYNFVIKGKDLHWTVIRSMIGAVTSFSILSGICISCMVSK